MICADEATGLAEDEVHGGKPSHNTNSGKQDVCEDLGDQNNGREALELLESQGIDTSSPSSTQKPVRCLPVGTSYNHLKKECEAADQNGVPDIPRSPKRRRCSNDDGSKIAEVPNEELRNWPAGFRSSGDQRTKGNDNDDPEIIQDDKAKHGAAPRRSAS